MQKNERTTPGDSNPTVRRALRLGPVILASLIGTGAAVASSGPGIGALTIVASGAHRNTDFNQDGRPDNRRFWFVAMERADGSVTGNARLRVLVDDLDQDGVPDVEPFVQSVRIQIRGAAHIADNEIFISGVVTASNTPVPCSAPDGSFSLAVGSQIGFVVKDNGNGTGPADQITPTIIWDCVPFLGSDYGVDDSVSFAEWALSQGFGPFLSSFLTDIEQGNMIVR